MAGRAAATQGSLPRRHPGRSASALHRQRPPLFSAHHPSAHPSLAPRHTPGAQSAPHAAHAAVAASRVRVCGSACRGSSCSGAGPVCAAKRRTSQRCERELRPRAPDCWRRAQWAGSTCINGVRPQAGSRRTHVSGWPCAPWRQRTVHADQHVSGPSWHCAPVPRARQRPSFTSGLSKFHSRFHPHPCAAGVPLAEELPRTLPQAPAP